MARKSVSDHVRCLVAHSSLAGAARSQSSQSSFRFLSDHNRLANFLPFPTSSITAVLQASHARNAADPIRTHIPQRRSTPYLVPCHLFPTSTLSASRPPHSHDARGRPLRPLHPQRPGRAATTACRQCQDPGAASGESLFPCPASHLMDRDGLRVANDELGRNARASAASSDAPRHDMSESEPFFALAASTQRNDWRLLQTPRIRHYEADQRLSRWLSARTIGMRLLLWDGRQGQTQLRALRLCDAP